MSWPVGREASSISDLPARAEGSSEPLRRSCSLAPDRVRKCELVRGRELTAV
jgi:hypothetical protein